MFSENLTIGVRGRSTYKTFIGLIFSLAYIGLLIQVTVNQFQNYVDVSNPAVFTDTYTTETYPKIEVVKQHLTPVILPFSTEVDFIDPEDYPQYMTVLAQTILWSYETNAEGESVLVKSFTTYETASCKNLSPEELQRYDYMKPDEAFYASFYEFGICMKIPANLTVEGKGTDQFYTLTSLRILPCSLDTGCRSFEEMTKVNFNIAIPVTGYNASDYEHPLSSRMSIDEAYYVHPFVKQTYLAKVRNLRVMDLVGVFPDWKLRNETWEIGAVSSITQFRSNVTRCTKQQVMIPDNPDCLPYYEYNLQSSGTVIINRRSYQSLSNTLGNIGGITQLVFVILVLIYRPINESLRRKFILNKVYPLLTDKDIGFGKQYVLPDKNAEDVKVLISEEKNQPGEPEGRHPYRAIGTIKEPSRRRSYLDKPKTGPQDGLPPDKSEYHPSSKQGISLFTRLSMPSLLCCCRKKSAKEQEQASRVSDAFVRIEESLDVLSIVRYFNVLRVLARLLLDRRHLDLAQYFGFDLWRLEKAELDREEQEERDRTAGNETSESATEKERRLTTIEQERRRFKNALKELAINSRKGELNLGSEEARVRALVDKIYSAHFLTGENLQDLQREDYLAFEAPKEGSAHYRTGESEAEFSLRSQKNQDFLGARIECAKLGSEEKSEGFASDQQINGPRIEMTKPQVGSLGTAVLIDGM